MNKSKAAKDVQADQLANTAMTTDGAPAPGVLPPSAPHDEPEPVEAQPKRRSKLSLNRTRGAT